MNDFDRAFAGDGANTNTTTTTTNNNNNNTPQQPPKTKYVVQPLTGVVPWKLETDGAPDLHLLTKEEVEVCNALHIQPKPYLVIKETLLKEAMKQSGALKRKDAKAACKVLF